MKSCCMNCLRNVQILKFTLSILVVIWIPAFWMLKLISWWWGPFSCYYEKRWHVAGMHKWWWNGRHMDLMHVDYRPYNNMKYLNNDCVVIVSLYPCKMCVNTLDWWCFKVVNLLRCLEIWIWNMWSVECEACLLCFWILLKHCCALENGLILGIYVCFHGMGSWWQPYSGFRGRAILPLQVLWTTLQLPPGLDGLASWGEGKLWFFQWSSPQVDLQYSSI